MAHASPSNKDRVTMNAPPIRGALPFTVVVSLLLTIVTATLGIKRWATSAYQSKSDEIDGGPW